MRQCDIKKLNNYKVNANKKRAIQKIYQVIS